jgi:hypothetical protein
LNITLNSISLALVVGTTNRRPTPASATWPLASVGSQLASPSSTMLQPTCFMCYGFGSTTMTRPHMKTCLSHACPRLLSSGSLRKWYQAWAGGPSRGYFLPLRSSQYVSFPHVQLQVEEDTDQYYVRPSMIKKHSYLKPTESVTIVYNTLSKPGSAIWPNKIQTYSNPWQCGTRCLPVLGGIPTHL